MKILDLAKAIEGPHRPVGPTGKASLARLRDVRWDMLSEQDQGMRLSEAQSVLNLLGTSIFHFTINGGPERVFHARTGVYCSAVAAIPAVFGIPENEFPIDIEIWVPELLPQYGPYVYRIEQIAGPVLGGGEKR